MSQLKWTFIKRRGKKVFANCSKSKATWLKKTAKRRQLRKILKSKSCLANVTFHIACTFCVMVNKKNKEYVYRGHSSVTSLVLFRTAVLLPVGWGVEGDSRVGDTLVGGNDVTVNLAGLMLLAGLKAVKSVTVAISVTFRLYCLLVLVPVTFFYLSKYVDVVYSFFTPKVTAACKYPYNILTSTVSPN